MHEFDVIVVQCAIKGMMSSDLDDFKETSFETGSQLEPLLDSLYPSYSRSVPKHWFDGTAAKKRISGCCCFPSIWINECKTMCFQEFEQEANYRWLHGRLEISIIWRCSISYTSRNVVLVSRTVRLANEIQLFLACSSEVKKRNNTSSKLKL